MKSSKIHGLIKVVNVKIERPTNLSYVGRYNSYFGRSVLGNPFKIGQHGSREEVIEKYKIWLNEQYKNNQLVKKAILELVQKVQNGENVILGCWCAPQACHAHVIKQKIVEIVQEQDKKITNDKNYNENCIEETYEEIDKFLLKADKKSFINQNLFNENDKGYF